MRKSRILKSIKDRGLKITPQRQLIAEVLEGNKEHPSAEDVYKKVIEIAPTVSIATVYKTLNSLADLGIIQRLDVGDSKAHFDPDTKSHSHFVCIKCRKIFDVYEELSIPEIDNGFKVLKGQAIYHGLCKDCENSQ
ncbi:MAG TPA: Fur family transcriptional regulator [bacterium]|jgi:Fur family peroxide stress response transcriptional regulator|nr:transcriptional repressor [Dictyoglomota bacterium]HHV80372.1 transcriptional repressor [bacterium]HOK29760.1 Fur family transcriptional regulator [bacterium]HON72331.1 Fur family transcriptional regulator [bacterium]HPC78565.1 Fur family transcriptional regulator [bacterium]